MAITLITGLPGHGKTLEAVRMMRDGFPDRKKYAANFKGLAYDFLNVEEFDPLQWSKCEAGSILFIDEAWEFFEARGPHRMPPDVIKELARHRHYGLDLVLICQGPFQLDAHLRSLVETHLHVIRPFGLGFSVVRTFRGVEARPDDRQARKNAVDVSKRRRFDKRLFDYYKSAEVHTVKRRLPLKMFGAVAAILFAVAALWNVLSWGAGFMSDTKNAVLAGQDVDSSSGPLPVDLGGALPGRSFASPVPGSAAFDAVVNSQRGAYFLAESSNVEGAPWTAQKWLEISEPVTFPKPRCMLAEAVSKCVCHSQQGTRLEVSFEVCSYLAVNGWFDPSLEDSPAEPVVDRRQLELAEQFGREHAQLELPAPGVVVGDDSSTLPYILVRLRDHRFIPSRSDR